MKTVLIVLLFVSALIVGNSSENPTLADLEKGSDWDSLLRVDDSCPRFVIAGKDAGGGLGDQLERLFTVIAVAVRHAHQNITLLRRDDYTTKSKHAKDGYVDTLEHVFGIPFSRIMKLSDATNRYKVKVEALVHPNATKYGELIGPSGNITKSLRCGEALQIDAYESCGGWWVSNGGWCPFFFSPQIREILYPLFSNSLRVCEYTPPLLKSFVNVVWHIRSGDACHHCNNFTYYDLIKHQIEGRLKDTHVRVNNIVIHQNDLSSEMKDQFKSNWNANFFSSDSPSKNVCLFLNSDILISEGSSFPVLSTWFTSHWKPIHFEEIRNFAVAQRAKYQHLLEDDEFLMKNGTIDTKLNLHHALMTAGVLSRISDCNTLPFNFRNLLTGKIDDIIAASKFSSRIRLIRRENAEVSSWQSQTMLYIINLKHRTDRLVSILTQLKVAQLSTVKTFVVDAYPFHQAPWIGCLTSHILAYSHFLAHSHNMKYAIVFEDDFVFATPTNFSIKISKYIGITQFSWDAIHLAYSTHKTNKENKKYLIDTWNVVRMKHVETSSAILSRKIFGRRLLQNFLDAAKINLGYLTENCLKGNNTHVNGRWILPKLDTFWAQLQESSQWYAAVPRLGHQMHSDFSDIEQSTVNYTKLES